MRQVMAITVVVVLVLAGWAGVGSAAVEEKAADDFSSGGYSGSTGTYEWSTVWVEGPPPESNGPGSGAVRVGNSNCKVAPCLNLQRPLTGLTEIHATRSIEVVGSSNATLGYHLDFPGGLGISGQILVQVSADGGGWQTLGSHSPGAAGTYVVDLPEFQSLDVRFTRSGLSLFESAAGIDNVEVLFTTATTTTTLPLTLPSITVPTIPLPPLTTTTVTTPSLTTTSTTSTTTTSPPSPTEPGDSAPPTTIAEPDPSNDESGAVVPPSTGGPPSSGGAVALTGVNPGLTAPAGRQTWAPQTGFLVRFGTDVEDFTLDILISVVLGIFLAVISDRRLGRHTES